MTDISPQLDSFPRHHESLEVKENKYEQEIARAVDVLRRNMHPETGLFPAVDKELDTPEARENHMEHAWIRDLAFDNIGMLLASRELKKAQTNPYLQFQLESIARNSLTKTLALFDQPRWLDEFGEQQGIIEEDFYTMLAKDKNRFDNDTKEKSKGPPMHMELNGDHCEWDQNQPEAWGDYLLALGMAFQDGVIKNYSYSERQVIGEMAKYLVRVKPWKFAAAGMWEGEIAHSPTSRSNAIAIAKGLEAVLPIFIHDESLTGEIKGTIEKTMEYVKEDMDRDYTMPSGHPDGADLAMMVTMALPGEEMTDLSFADYVTANGMKLQIGSLPGVIRFMDDEYYKGELGEARWFMGEPVLAIGYFQEARKAVSAKKFELARTYREVGMQHLKRALELEAQYGYVPELFLQRDPEVVAGNPNVLYYHDGEKSVALEPLPRSLLWNNALMAAASGMAIAILEEDMSGSPTSELPLAA